MQSMTQYIFITYATQCHDKHAQVGIDMILNFDQVQI